MKTWIYACCMMVAGSLAADAAQAASEKAEIARKGYAFLKEYCHRCHGVNFVVEGLNVLDRANLLADRGPNQPHWLVEGNPAGSEIWDRVGVRKDMPPQEAAQPTDEERAQFQQWIVAGAPFPVREERQFQGEADTLKAIRDHLAATPRADRKFQQYLSLASMYNNQKLVTDDELKLGRAALGKLINSLSWKANIVPPLPLDAQQTVFRIDIRDYGWDKKDLWKEVVKAYPYGLKQSGHQNDDVRQLASEIKALSGDDLAYLRADWFIATASRPPLYHVLLEIPENVAELRTRLNVAPKSDFLDNQLARAGLITSKVSKQNRLLDRHHSLYGYYWESYDFKHNDGTGDLQQFPLGPKFDNHPFVFQSFEHDGGEIIFSLPNGMQGYMLVDNKGKRINEGPIEIVRDSLETSGNPVIVNGLSCMACHSRGPVRFQAQEALRDNTQFTGSVREKVQKLFRRQTEFDQMLAKDEQRFLKSMQAAAGMFLQVGDDADKPLTEFSEPIGTMARWYNRDLSPEVVAAEMGIANPADVPAMIRANRRLGKAGLAPLERGGTVKRDVWSQIKDDNSPFYEFAKELGLGDPLFVKDTSKKDGALLVQTAVKQIAVKPASATATETAKATASAKPAVKTITPVSVKKK